MSVAPAEPVILQAWFIDPYRRCATPVRIQRSLQEWYKALRCDTLDMTRIAYVADGTREVDLWIDDCGRLRNPPAPIFNILGRDYYGYGLVFEANKEGDTLSVTFDWKFLAERLLLGFQKDWEKFVPDLSEYLDQMTRVIEWEDWYQR